MNLFKIFKNGWILTVEMNNCIAAMGNGIGILLKKKQDNIWSTISLWGIYPKTVKTGPGQKV